jgi:hypothetical protein
MNGLGIKRKKNNMAYMKNIDILLRKKYNNEELIVKMKSWISMFLKGDIDFNELPFTVKVFLCELDIEKNCEELNTNVSAQIIIAKRSGLAKFVVYLKRKLKKIKNFFKKPTIIITD